MAEEESVSAYLRFSDSSLVLQPSGTFKGHGGYIGIGPYREYIGADISEQELGAVVKKLLNLSGSTGYHVRDIDKYRSDQFDAESLRIHGEVFSKIKSGREFASKYKSVKIWRERHELQMYACLMEHDNNKDLCTGVNELALSGDSDIEVGCVVLYLLGLRKKRE